VVDRWGDAAGHGFAGHFAAGPVRGVSSSRSPMWRGI
jgi:hypothetical protein